MFKDKKLRQAIGALVNRPEFAQKVFLGQICPLYSMIPMGMSTNGHFKMPPSATATWQRRRRS